MLEQSPPELDEYIQPTDSAVLLSSLTKLSVERFELPSGGEPRSLAIRFEFAENEYFSDSVLEKKFWWRHHRDGWAGLVSEPVKINWKSKDKDLTGGMLDLVIQVAAEEKAAGKKTSEADSDAKKALREAMDNTGLGGVSFFAWFGFRGRDVSEEESKEAYKLELEKRKKRKAGEEVDEEDEEDDEADDDLDYEWEVFPIADDIAVAIAEDVWPGAIKYFRKFLTLFFTVVTRYNSNMVSTVAAQENDALSDLEFEESDEEMAEGEDEDAAEDHPSKKRKADE